MNVVSHWSCSEYEPPSALGLRVRWHNVNLKVLSAALTMVMVSLITGQAMAQSANTDSGTAPECKCRSPDGQMQALGTVQCVDIAGRKNLVRCKMSTNTPYWKRVEGTSGCPDA